LRENALQIVGDGGAAALSIEALSERSGLSPDEVHEHYPTAAVCAYDVYNDASVTLLGPVFGAFDNGVSWESGFLSATQGLLTQVIANPLQARLWFVEAPRVDRELRRRCEHRRRELVDFLTGEYERRRRAERLSDVQIELLVGATCHAISEALAAEDPDQLLGVGTNLAELAGVFEPAAA
jgi:hypothetical protein